MSNDPYTPPDHSGSPPSDTSRRTRLSALWFIVPCTVVFAALGGEILAPVVRTVGDPLGNSIGGGIGGCVGFVIGSMLSWIRGRRSGNRE